ncbi:hypothetical protein SLA2020_425270 [Shorea laevis]
MEWCNIHEVLERYERASKQTIKRGKTSIFFSKNTHQNFRHHIFSIVGGTSQQSYEKYLGLPAMVGQHKRRTFAGIQGRVRSKLSGWKEKFLSQTGREILIKAVIQAIPTYSMSIFQFPKSLCKELNSVMCHFYWCQKDKETSMIWTSWGKMGRSKSQGGMGFRDLECFNLALLAKQGWRLLQFPTSLAAQVLKAKYFPNTSFLEASLGTRPSYAWRSICKSNPLLDEGLIWRWVTVLPSKFGETSGSLAHNSHDTVTGAHFTCSCHGIRSY